MVKVLPGCFSAFSNTAREQQAPGVLRPSGLTRALAWLAGDAMLERVRRADAQTVPDWEAGQTGCEALRHLPRDEVVA